MQKATHMAETFKLDYYAQPFLYLGVTICICCGILHIAPLIPNFTKRNFTYFVLIQGRSARFVKVRYKIDLRFALAFFIAHTFRINTQGIFRKSCCAFSSKNLAKCSVSIDNLCNYAK